MSDERVEAETVVGVMQQLHAQGRHKWKDMAILYRTNAQSRLFEEQLVSCVETLALSALGTCLPLSALPDVAVRACTWLQPHKHLSPTCVYSMLVWCE